MIKTKIKLNFKDKEKLNNTNPLMGNINFVYLNQSIYNNLNGNDLDIINQNSFQVIFNAKILPKYIASIDLKLLDFCNKYYIE